MSAEGQPPDEPTQAEERLLGLLLLLQAESRGAPSTASVMRAVRWQTGLRNALRTLGTLAGSVTDGLSLLLGVRRPR